MVIIDKDNQGRKEEFIRAGVEDFYFKPFMFDEFISHLLKNLTKTEIDIKKTVLVVDDSKLHRVMMTKILTDMGIKVMTAVDGVDGIKKLNENNIDLIVTDLFMPKIDGERLIKLVKENKRFKDIPIIVTTTADKDKKLFTCFELGAADFITKPFAESEIIARLKRFLK